MVHKYTVAAEREEPEVVLWGSGAPTREFLFVDDAARALLLAAEQADTSAPFNVGTGVETRIRELAEKISVVCRVHRPYHVGQLAPGRPTSPVPGCLASRRDHRLRR